MTMTISSFFEFPGILITIGIILLLLSIIIIVIAVKSDKKEDFKIKNEEFKEVNQFNEEESTSYNEPEENNTFETYQQEIPKVQVPLDETESHNNEDEDIELL